MHSPVRPSIPSQVCSLPLLSSRLRSSPLFLLSSFLYWHLCSSPLLSPLVSIPLAQSFSVSWLFSPRLSSVCYCCLLSPILLSLLVSSCFVLPSACLAVFCLQGLKVSGSAHLIIHLVMADMRGDGHSMRCNLRLCQLAGPAQLLLA